MGQSLPCDVRPVCAVFSLRPGTTCTLPDESTRIIPATWQQSKPLVGWPPQAHVSPRLSGQVNHDHLEYDYVHPFADMGFRGDRYAGHRVGKNYTLDIFHRPDADIPPHRATT